MVEKEQIKVPQDIIVKIISRLPLKSIIQCKLWRCLNSNPLLVKSDPTYFAFHEEKSARFAIFDYVSDSTMSSRSTNKAHRVLEDEMVLTGLPIMHTKIMTILGSCNGLICFLKSREFEGFETIHVYNPTVGETFALPKPNLELCSPLPVSYGFGFCPITNQYKLLKVPRTGDHDEVEVYTLGSRQGWRRVDIGDDPHQVRRINYSEPICGGGDIYWLHVLKPQTILSFNLAVEEFGLVPLPPIGDDNMLWDLGYLDHSLIAPIKLGSDMEIWVKKDSGWSKDWVLPITIPRLVPTKILADGRILMMHRLNRMLHCYDPKDKRFVDCVLNSSCSTLVPYTPTLVSPKQLMEGVDPAKHSIL